MIVTANGRGAVPQSCSRLRGRRVRAFDFIANSLEDTVHLGRTLGEVAVPGLVVGLVGELGSGKTAFVRAVAEGLDIPNPRAVTSPTFVLIQEYTARLPVYHFDVYRLERPEQFADLGPQEYFAGDGVCLIEWADRVMALLPPERLLVTFAIAGADTRGIHCRSMGSRYDGLLTTWQSRVGARNGGSPRP